MADHRLCLYRGGDAPFDARLMLLLGHKGSPYLEHVREFLAHGADGCIEGLEWRFHVALCDEEPVANICLWEAFGVGLLGHVYTAPEHRGRGLASRLMEAAVAGARERGLFAMDLNTDPGSSAAAIYGRHGFRARPTVAGSMRLVLKQEPEDSSAPMEESFRWAHWPRLNEFLLREEFSGRGESALGLELPASAEGATLKWRFHGGGTPLLIWRGAGGRIVGARLGDRETGHLIKY